MSEEASHVSGPRVAGARIIVLGCGRIGEYVSHALKTHDVPHVVTEYDPARIAHLRAAGIPFVYGDASAEPVLAQTRPHRADMAIVALPEAATTERAVRLLRRLAPHIRIVARIHRGEEIPRLRAAGADGVVYAEFEAGTEMIRQALGSLGVSGGDVETYIGAIRADRYRHAEQEAAAR
jgi:CPA2 family monovalent cation:H+ antiporter-2